jgi:hypothetical protein
MGFFSENNLRNGSNNVFKGATALIPLSNKKGKNKNDNSGRKYQLHGESMAEYGA